MATDIDVPVGLAGLFEPNQSEALAAKLDRPFLIGAYGLDRIAGRGRIEEIANQTNAIKTMLALRKLQQDRNKDALHYATQAPVLERFDQPANILNQVFKPYDIDLPPAVPGLPAAIQAQKRKPNGSINLGDETKTEESFIYRNVKTGETRSSANPPPPGGIDSGEWIPVKQSLRVKTKTGVPAPPDSAAPKATAPTPAPAVKVPAGVQRGQTFRGPDGKLYRAE